MEHRNSIDLNRRDKNGHGVLDHAIALDPQDPSSPTFTDVVVIKLIMKLNFDKQSLAQGLTLARSLGSDFSGTIIGRKDQKTSGTPSEIKTNYRNNLFNFEIPLIITNLLNAQVSSIFPPIIWTLAFRRWTIVSTWCWSCWISIGSDTKCQEDECDNHSGWLFPLNWYFTLSLVHMWSLSGCKYQNFHKCNFAYKCS